MEVDIDVIKRKLKSHLKGIFQVDFNFASEACFEGLIGITLDKTDILLVNLNETMVKTTDPCPTQDTPCTLLPAKSLERNVVQGTTSKSVTEARSKPMNSKRNSVPDQSRGVVNKKSLSTEKRGDANSVKRRGVVTSSLSGSASPGSRDATSANKSTGIRIRQKSGRRSVEVHKDQKVSADREEDSERMNSQPPVVKKPRVGEQSMEDAADVDIADIPVWRQRKRKRPGKLDGFLSPEKKQVAPPRSGSSQGRSEQVAPLRSGNSQGRREQVAPPRSGSSQGRRRSNKHKDNDFFKESAAVLALPADEEFSTSVHEATTSEFPVRDAANTRTTKPSNMEEEATLSGVDISSDDLKSQLPCSLEVSSSTLGDATRVLAAVSNEELGLKATDEDDTSTPVKCHSGNVSDIREEGKVVVTVLEPEEVITRISENVVKVETPEERSSNVSDDESQEESVEIRDTEGRRSTEATNSASSVIAIEYESKSSAGSAECPLEDENENIEPEADTTACSLSTESSPKPNVLTLEQKVAVLSRSAEGLSNRRISQEFKCGRTQVSNILKAQEEIMYKWNTGHNPQAKYLNPRRLNQELDERCFEWYQRSKEEGMAVSGSRLQERASAFALELGVENFQASATWLEGFKKRHNIRFLIR